MWLVVSKIVNYLISPLSVALILFLFTLFFAILRYKKTSRSFLIIGVLLLLVTSMPLVARQMVGSFEGQYPPIALEQMPSAKLIVVLGGAIALPISPRLEIELTSTSDRVLHAFRLFKGGKAPKIFLTAGNINKEAFEQSEAFYISQLLMDWGVPREVIEIAGESRNTRENALEVHDYLEQNQLLKEQIILVTSAIHMPRAIRVFEKIGINVIPGTTDVSVGVPVISTVENWLPSLGAMNSFTKALHEFLGVVYYRLRGWV